MVQNVQKQLLDRNHRLILNFLINLPPLINGLKLRYLLRAEVPRGISGNALAPDPVYGSGAQNDDVLGLLVNFREGYAQLDEVLIVRVK